MDTTVEQLEQLTPSQEEITEMIVYLRTLRKDRGEKPKEFPDLTLEQQQLAEKNESILEKVWDGCKKAFDFLIVEPAKWIGRQIKDHPIRTILIALAAFALWYYSAPLTAGLSAIKEEGIAVTSDLLGKAASIDPTQVDVFDQLMSAPM